MIPTIGWRRRPGGGVAPSQTQEGKEAKTRPRDGETRKDPPSDSQVPGAPLSAAPPGLQSVTAQPLKLSNGLITDTPEPQQQPDVHLQPPTIGLGLGPDPNPIAAIDPAHCHSGSPPPGLRLALGRREPGPPSSPDPHPDPPSEACDPRGLRSALAALDDLLRSPSGRGLPGPRGDPESDHDGPAPPPGLGLPQVAILRPAERARAKGRPLRAAPPVSLGLAPCSASQDPYALLGEEELAIGSRRADVDSGDDGSGRRSGEKVRPVHQDAVTFAPPGLAGPASLELGARAALGPMHFPESDMCMPPPLPPPPNPRSKAPPPSTELEPPQPAAGKARPRDKAPADAAGQYPLADLSFHADPPPPPGLKALKPTRGPAAAPPKSRGAATGRVSKPVAKKARAGRGPGAPSRIAPVGDARESGRQDGSGSEEEPIEILSESDDEFGEGARDRATKRKGETAAAEGPLGLAPTPIRTEFRALSIDFSFASVSRCVPAALLRAGPLMAKAHHRAADPKKLLLSLATMGAAAGGGTGGPSKAQAAAGHGPAGKGASAGAPVLSLARSAPSMAPRPQLPLGLSAPSQAILRVLSRGVEVGQGAEGGGGPGERFYRLALFAPAPATAMHMEGDAAAARQGPSTIAAPPSRSALPPVRGRALTTAQLRRRTGPSEASELEPMPTVTVVASPGPIHAPPGPPCAPPPARATAGPLKYAPPPPPAPLTLEDLEAPSGALMALDDLESFEIDLDLTPGLTSDPLETPMPPAEKVQGAALGPGTGSVYRSAAPSRTRLEVPAFASPLVEFGGGEGESRVKFESDPFDPTLWSAGEGWPVDPQEFNGARKLFRSDGGRLRGLSLVPPRRMATVSSSYA